MLRQNKFARLGYILLMLGLWPGLASGCALVPEPTQIVVYLPTATATATPTFTPTPKPTLTPNPPPTLTRPPTVTPEPWLEIELTIRDVATGQAVVGDVYIVLFVDDETISELIEENVSAIQFNLPRGSTRADAIFVQVFAVGYLARGVRLPPNSAQVKRISLEVLLEKAKR
jgi:hypothetical protein